MRLRGDVWRATVADDFRRGDSRAVWRIAKGGFGRREEQSLRPIRDAEGNLQVTPEAIAHVWECHYREMFRDKTGHSRDRSYWEDKPVRVRQPGAGVEYLDRELQESEIASVLQEMKNWKAAGPDGVIPELLKVAAPDCPMRASIVKVLRRVWNEGILEKEWELAEVVTIPKKGDPEQVDNYRGISLLPVGLKIIYIIARDA
ncbi:MAG: uncharacterized protein A8A55_2815 [Amphiamblys sp. WSBS2006]|nr:MAG: uncharacterized protein A8A55_2815 [Amphiamblys sp. WSBS2006]